MFSEGWQVQQRTTSTKEINPQVKTAYLIQATAAPILCGSNYCIAAATHHSLAERVETWVTAIEHIGLNHPISWENPDSAELIEQLHVVCAQSLQVALN